MLDASIIKTFVLVPYRIKIIKLTALILNLLSEIRLRFRRIMISRQKLYISFAVKHRNISLSLFRSVNEYQMKKEGNREIFV